MTSLNDKKSLMQFYLAEPKLLVRRIVNRHDRLSVAFADERLVFKKDVNPFIVTDARFDTKYLLGLMASKLVSYLYLKSSSIATKDDFRQTTLAELRKLLIPIVSKEKQQPIIQLVAQILTLKKNDPNFDTCALEIEIDQLVYELYGLTEDEIKIVEGK